MTDVFANDYNEARQRFRDAATALGWPCRAFVVDGLGPHGEELTIDVASSSWPALASSPWASPSPSSSPSGSRSSSPADRVLVVSSGLHGIEGFFGSAAQCATMARWSTQPPAAAIRYVFIHALNPHGFAWQRRVDAGNVDPNRNFLPDGAPFRGSPATYAALDGLLNPRHPPSRLDPLLPRAVAAIARHGMPALKQALTAGQHDFPRGLFFGGHEPSHTRIVLEEHFRSWVGSASQVLHLDLHTGLGASGSCALLVDYAATAHQQEALTRWFGQGSYELSGSRGVGYQAHGSLGPWCLAGRFAPEYVFAFAEFGTYSNLKVLAGLRAENQAHFWGRPDAPASVRATRRLRELFCPAGRVWRSTVLERSHDLIERGARGLAASSRLHP
ncbi:MAG: M14 family metallopeptidase [Acidobacteriota bacterium]